MSYIVSALSLDGDVEVLCESAAEALAFAMRLGARGCRGVAITGPDGKTSDVTSFYRLHQVPNDPRAGIAAA